MRLFQSRKWALRHAASHPTAERILPVSPTSISLRTQAQQLRNCVRIQVSGLVWLNSSYQSGRISSTFVVLAAQFLHSLSQMKTSLDACEVTLPFSTASAMS